MKRLLYTLTATAAASASLALATPALAAYSGAGQLPAAGNQGANGANGANGALPAAGAEAPAQSPIVPLGTAAAGILLIGTGGFAIRRRRASESL